MLAVTILFGSLVWHLVRMCFVQVGRLKRCCCCLHGVHCDSSDMNDALWMYIIPLIQDVLLASASWLAVDNTFSLRLLSLHSCNEYLSLQKKGRKKKHQSTHQSSNIPINQHNRSTDQTRHPKPSKQPTPQVLA